MRHLSRAILAALAILALSMPVGIFSAFSAEEIVVRHAQGTTLLPARPQEVVVYDLAALDTLDALHVEVVGVPGSNVPDALARYRADRYQKVGSLFEPDFEAVSALQPDLIIVGARSAAKLGELSRIAPTIDLTIDSAHFVEGARSNVGTLGRIFGKEEAAADLVAQIDAAVARARAAAQGSGTALMIMVNGGKVTAYGPGSRFGWLHDEIGVAPAIEHVEAATHGEAISFEFILKTDPDWLIVLDRDVAVGRPGTPARQVLDNELVAATRAAKSGRILYVDPARWYIIGGGATALASIADEIASAFEAKKFEAKKGD